MMVPGWVYIFPTIMFVFVIIIFSTVFKQFAKANQYKSMPKVNALATIVGKRDYHSNSFTYYYATFQFESGDRIELRVPRQHVGLLVEGDHGMLIYQGDMFVAFDNNAQDDLY